MYTTPSVQMESTKIPRKGVSRMKLLRHLLIIVLVLSVYLSLQSNQRSIQRFNTTVIDEKISSKNHSTITTNLYHRDDNSHGNNNNNNNNNNEDDNENELVASILGSLPPTLPWTSPNAKPKQIVVFYNIYIPETQLHDEYDNDHTTTMTTIARNNYNESFFIDSSTTDKKKSSRSLQQKLSYGIIEEQIKQIGMSYASSSNQLTLYYNTIGSKIDTEWMHHICYNNYNITCTLMKHYKVGYEDKTLKKVKKYCTKYSYATVVYLHNKGSFHPASTQTNWRRTATAAATSELCLTPLSSVPTKNGNDTVQEQTSSSHTNTCNVCGLLFQPLPAPHFPGNMWSAKCSYINQLLTLEEYRIRRKAVSEWVEQDKQGVDNISSSSSSSSSLTPSNQSRKFSFVLFNTEDHFTGQDRYQAEHWVGSHPDLIPCDVSAKSNLNYWLKYQKFSVNIDPKLFQPLSTQQQQPPMLNVSSSTAVVTTKKQQRKRIFNGHRVKKIVSYVTKKYKVKNYHKEFHYSLAPRKTIYDDWVWYSYSQFPDIIWYKGEHDIDDNNASTLSSSNRTTSTKMKKTQHYQISPVFNNLELYQLRLNDYYLLRGILAKYHLLYNQMPNTSLSSPSSWIWKWYPDGELWRRHVQLYGMEALNKVVVALPILEEQDHNDTKKRLQYAIDKSNVRKTKPWQHRNGLSKLVLKQKMKHSKLKSIKR